jgi:hypothetical protein
MFNQLSNFLYKGLILIHIKQLYRNNIYINEDLLLCNNKVKYK